MSKQRIGEYFGRRMGLLELTDRMWSDSLVQCYNDKTKPDREEESLRGSVFLAGPTTRNQIVEYNWRAEAVSFLRKAGFIGYIYVPEPRGEEHEQDFTERSYIHEWESSRLLHATKQVYWIPRNAGELLGLNTNLELGVTLGMILAHGRNPETVFIGWPREAVRMGLPRHYAIDLAGCIHHSTLRELCYAVAGKTPFAEE